MQNYKFFLKTTLKPDTPNGVFVSMRGLVGCKLHLTM